MDISVSPKTAKVVRQFKLRPQELAFADLVATGWEPEDAWNVAVREGMTWNKKARNEAISSLLNSPSVSERIDATKAVLRKNQIESVKNTASNERRKVVNDAMSKENMLFDLQTALGSKDIGSSEWIKIKQLIVDVTRMKQDEVKDEETTIHHFLPVAYPTSCEDCLF